MGYTAKRPAFGVDKLGTYVQACGYMPDVCGKFVCKIV